MNNRYKRSRLAEAVDFSYKRNPLRVAYDIEVLPSVFTVCLLAEGYGKLVVVTGDGWDDGNTPSVGELREVLREALGSRFGVEAVGENPELFVEVYRDSSSDPATAIVSRAALRDLFSRILEGRDPFVTSSRFTEYYGWNSGNYDLPMLAVASLLADSPGATAGGSGLTTGNLRCASDVIISHDGPPWSLFDAMERGTGGVVRSVDFRKRLRRAFWHDCHVDVAKILLRSDSDSEGRAYPPGLKREMGKYGLDIVEFGGLGAADGGLAVGDKSSLCGLCGYNVNDVVGTALLARRRQVVSSVRVRDDIRALYPFTSARAVDARFMEREDVPLRDCTMADLAARVIVGPRRERMVDSHAVSYMFPLPCGTVDLLEYMRETEDFMPDDLYEFFAHFRGKDMSTRKADFEVKRAQPVSHGPMLNVPFYRDGVPVDSYIRLSTGGAHGAVMAGLSKFSAGEVAAWSRSDAGAADFQKVTMDIEGCIHLDFSSFYPMLCCALGVFRSERGGDRYTSIRDERVAVKEGLPGDVFSWGEVEREANRRQNNLKLVLNSATGNANTKSRFALLPLDNKIQSMRLDGNLIIWCLGQRLVQAGAFVVSLNTDGIYVAGIGLDEARRVVDNFVDKYGVAVEPEVIERFINRDTSNRVEFQNGKISAIGGELKSGINPVYGDNMLGATTPVPLVVPSSVLKYVSKPGWLEEKYSRERLEGIVRGVLSEVDSLEPWYVVHTGSSVNRLTVDGVPAGKVNRLVLTNDGSVLGQDRAASLKMSVAEKLLGEFRERVSNGGVVTGSDLAGWFEREGLEPCSPRPIDENVVLVSFSKAKYKRAVPEETGELAEWCRNGGDGKPKFSLGIKDIRGSGVIVPLRVWGASETVSGFPESRGVVLNRASEIAEFDRSRLNIGAYVDWAEKIILRWKVTGDIDELGLKFVDDPAVSLAGLGRDTVRGRMVRVMTDLYDSCVPGGVL